MTDLTDNHISEILHRALATYGPENQLWKLLEEMAELQDAICKSRHGRATLDDIRTEIADVFITLAQAAIHFGDRQVWQEIQAKLSRLETRLDQ